MNEQTPKSVIGEKDMASGGRVPASPDGLTEAQHSAGIAGRKVWVCLNDDCAAVYEEWPGQPHCRACDMNYGPWAVRYVRAAHPAESPHPRTSPDGGEK